MPVILARKKRKGKHELKSKKGSELGEEVIEWSVKLKGKRKNTNKQWIRKEIWWLICSSWGLPLALLHRVHTTQIECVLQSQSHQEQTQVPILEVLEVGVYQLEINIFSTSWFNLGLKAQSKSAFLRQMCFHIPIVILIYLLRIFLVWWQEMEGGLPYTWFCATK